MTDGECFGTEVCRRASILELAKSIGPQKQETLCVVTRVIVFSFIAIFYTPETRDIYIGKTSRRFFA